MDSKLYYAQVELSAIDDYDWLNSIIIYLLAKQEKKEIQTSTPSQIVRIFN